MDFNKFYKDNYQAAFNSAFTYLRCIEDAEEVVNDVMYKISRVEKHLDNAKGYLMISIKNTCITKLRRKSKVRIVETNNIPINSTDHLEVQKEAMEEVNSIVSNMPYTSRRTFELVYYQDMKFKEAAKILKINSNTLRGYTSRQIQGIKSHFLSKGIKVKPLQERRKIKSHEKDSI